MKRRNFIQLTSGSLSALLISQYVKAEGKKISLMPMPDSVIIRSGDVNFPLQSSDKQTWTFKDLLVRVKNNKDAVLVLIQSPTLSLQEVKLSWKIPAIKNTIVVGDAWERTYGDISWQPINATKKLPWYCVENADNNTTCFGVKTGCSTICYWRVADDHLELNLDTRNGGGGVQLGTRMLSAAEIVTTKNEGNENVFATVRRFCKQMCDKPRLPKQPVYGINDWYFAYGNNSADLILKHTSLLAPFATNSNNKPFSVIDDGWSLGSDYSRTNDKFPDMPKLVNDIENLGMRPGIWTRPLLAKPGESKRILAPNFSSDKSADTQTLDPTIDENIQRIKNLFILYKQWGFEMVKFDYTTFDIFGTWGFKMTDNMTTQGWHFNDQTKTNAEIILYMYKSIRDAAGDMYLIACNTLSHLSAGIFELNRIGDDTSGKEWSRTKKMGVNTMGFRMVQHKNFYAVDGDCVGLTTAIPWEKNKQWMQLLAQSSAPLFISAQPDAVGAEQKDFIKQCFDIASKDQPVGEPLDWLTNPIPSKWKLDNKEVDFNWD